MGVKVYDGSSAQWVEFGGGGGSGASGTPGGNDKQVQFNDNGTLAGADALEFIKDTNNPDLILKPASTQASGIYGGNIIVQSTINTGTTPWNSTSITADGGLEIFRTRISSPAGGPYIDYKAQGGVDFDSRIQMDYANGNVDNGAIDPTSADYSALTFQTGGNSYYDASTNATGRTTEKIRIGKFGEIGISAGVQIYDPTQNPPIIFNNRTDAQKYGSSGAVIVSNGKGSSVSWSKQPVASAYVNFDGTSNTGGNCNMRDAYNVSSVSDVATGIYNVNFTTNFPNVNYTVTTSLSSNPFIANSTHGVLYTNGYFTNYVVIECFRDEAAQEKLDKNEIGVVVFTTHT
tara:strand:+ start:143 stop:1180 length:1038 start_codon:yes stop_codon:yes gene_type:complete